MLFPDYYDSMLMNPQNNRENLAETTLAELPERLLEGNWLDDMEGALWKREMIDRFRIINAPEFQRVVIGVDPAVTATPGSDETGIVVAERDRKGKYHILRKPLSWNGRERSNTNTNAGTPTG